MFANVSNDQLDQIQDILAQLDSKPVHHPAGNRRTAPRMKLHTSMQGYALNHTGQHEVKLYTRNISKSGIGFVARRPFKIGEHVALCFEVPNQIGKLVLARVTFSRYVSAGVYDIGAEFVESTPDTRKHRVPSHWIPTAAVLPTAAAQR